MASHLAASEAMAPHPIPCGGGGRRMELSCTFTISEL